MYLHLLVPSFSYSYGKGNFKCASEAFLDVTYVLKLRVCLILELSAWRISLTTSSLEFHVDLRKS